jgi:hypothetical protein
VHDHVNDHVIVDVVGVSHAGETSFFKLRQ